MSEAEDGRPKNWFDRGGEAYAQFRPEYPADLASFLASLAPSYGLAVDVGCGNGQLTTQLAPHFDTVIGTDPSVDQIRNAHADDGVRYVVAAAESMPILDRSTALITAAQAAHWFDRRAFYSEVRRIAADQAVLALVSYGVMQFEPDLDARFRHFYRFEIGPYWPPERRLVDSGYADIEFPFTEVPAPPMEICKEWTLDETLGYISTWSAVRAVEAAQRTPILHSFAADLRSIWGEPTRRRRITWPVNMRLGAL
ncbi:class I SAM-dependent methyltransferase [Rhodococcus sp. (in: high G+C Gram-positive bacteria)]|uniref:class I SAM-dependent methyltransferase n=1 Tax=Rhodococcus sp. TaxID=1831 RepID=UPI00389018E6